MRLKRRDCGACGYVFKPSDGLDCPIHCIAPELLKLAKELVSTRLVNADYGGCAMVSRRKWFHLVQRAVELLQRSGGQ